MSEELKACKKCGVEKPLSAFSWIKAKRRYNARCKTCLAEQSREYHSKHPDSARLRVAEWRKRNPEKYQAQLASQGPRLRAYKKIDNKRRPLVWGARRAVNNAIAAGTLERMPCEVCGRANAEAHHHSYEKEYWFDVKWLCTEHHREEHARMRDEERRRKVLHSSETGELSE